MINSSLFRQLRLATVAIATVMILGGCSEEETVSVAPVEAEPSAVVEEVVIDEAQPDLVVESGIRDDDGNYLPAPEPADAAAADVDPAASEQEVEVTYQLDSELDSMIDQMSGMLPDYQAEALREEQARWRANGFKCPNGPGYHSCAQYHIQMRMRQLRGRVEQVTTRGVASPPTNQ